MGRKITQIVSSFLISYLVAFFIFGIPLVRVAQAGNSVLNELNQSVYERSGNYDLLYAITHGQTKLGKNVTGDSTTTFIPMNSPKYLIAKYSPVLQQGKIAVVWIHNFLIPQNYNKWVSQMKMTEDKYCSNSVGSKCFCSPDKTWCSIEALNKDGKWTSGAVLFHVITPQEVFKDELAADGKTVIKSGDILHNLDNNTNSVNYNKITSCSANNLSSTYCDTYAFKAGQTLFFDIVSAIARKQNIDTGFAVIQQTSTHTVVHKHHHTFKSSIDVDYYLDSKPVYYMLVPPFTPGTNTPTSGFTANGMGYLRVDQKTAKGWDWSQGSRKFDSDHKSGWNGWVGIAMGGLGGLLSMLAFPGMLPYLNPGVLGSAGYTGWASSQVVNKGNFGTFHGAFQYNKLSSSLGNGKFNNLCRVDSSTWLKAQFGSEFDGSKTALSYSNNMNDMKYNATFTRPTLTDEQREQIKEMQEQ